MSAIGVAALAGALLVVPVPAVASVRLAGWSSSSDQVSVGRRLDGLTPRQGGLAAGAVALSVTVLCGLSLLTGVSAAIAAVGAAVLLLRRRVAGREAREYDALIDAVSVLAAEFRAGRLPGPALASAADAAVGAPRSVLAAAASSGRFGGDVPALLREAAGCAPASRAVLARLAAAWQLGERAGAPLTALLDGAERSARADRLRRGQLNALLAEPRSTATALALLPVAGLGLGGVVGAHPLHVLLHTSLGQLALLAGTVLDLLGMVWIARLARSAGEPA